MIKWLISSLSLLLISGLYEGIVSRLRYLRKSKLCVDMKSCPYFSGFAIMFLNKAEHEKNMIAI
jgi:hypothetical protein